MRADIFTKAFSNGKEWQDVCEMINIVKPDRKEHIRETDDLHDDTSRQVQASEILQSNTEKDAVGGKMTDREMDSMWRKMQVPCHMGAPALTKKTENEMTDVSAMTEADKENIKQKQVKYLSDVMNNNKNVWNYSDGVKIIQIYMARLITAMTKSVEEL